MLVHLFEPIATSCNILANAVILHAMCRDSRTPIPTSAPVLQVSANVSWMSFASSRKDWYLLTTASASFLLQLISCVLRGRSRRDALRKPIRLDTSNDELPRITRSPDVYNVQMIG